MKALIAAADDRSDSFEERSSTAEPSPTHHTTTAALRIIFRCTFRQLYDRAFLVNYLMEEKHRHRIYRLFGAGLGQLAVTPAESCGFRKTIELFDR